MSLPRSAWCPQLRSRVAIWAGFPPNWAFHLANSRVQFLVGGYPPNWALNPERLMPKKNNKKNNCNIAWEEYANLPHPAHPQAYIFCFLRKLRDTDALLWCLSFTLLFGEPREDVRPPYYPIVVLLFFLDCFVEHMWRNGKVGKIWKEV